MAGVVDAMRRLFRGALPDDSTDQDWLRTAADMGDDRISAYDTYDAWYDGEHGLKLNADAKRFLEGQGIPFSENFVEVVVDTYARRLAVESFQVGDNDQASEWINDVMWPANNFDSLQSVVHTETPKLGDGFVVAEWDLDRDLPRFSWNRPHLIKPIYSDDNDEMVYAVKKWSSCAKGLSNPNGVSIWRMNVYFPDRIEKWFSADKDGEQWERWFEEGSVDEAGALVWPLDWTDENDEPLGIPVFHFRNKPGGGKMGRSEVRGAIPHNRLLNKYSVDQFFVMDLQGSPTTTATGVPEAASLKTGAGRMLRATDKDARFGQIDAADPGPMDSSLEKLLARMAAKTATPLHDLLTTGDQPSGEARKTAESNHVQKCEDFHTANGTVWGDQATRFGWKLATVFGADDVPDFDPDAPITTHWASAETRSEESDATVALADFELGVSRRTLLRKRGYDPDEEQKQRAKEDGARSSAPPPPEGA